MPSAAPILRPASPVRQREGGRPAHLAPGSDASAALTAGLDFATQDYLALARHRMPDMVRAADTAAALLTHRIARFLMLPEARLYGSGTQAIRAACGGVLQPGDDIIIDTGTPAFMTEAALAAGARPHRAPPGSLDGVERRLRRLSRQPRAGRLYVAVPAVAPLTSITAELAELVQLCAAHGARLIVDVSHDLGSTGQAGRGLQELQGCLGQIDVVLGSFAKSFGAPGGFVALRDPDVAARLPTSAPIRPVQAAAILAAFDLIESTEGRRRRRSLHGIALRLRNHLMADGLRVLGQPSPLVPVPLPPGAAEAMTALLRSAGPLVPLLRAPLVAGHAPRWRILLSSDHGPADIDDLADLIRDITRSFDRARRVARRPQALPQP